MTTPINRARGANPVGGGSNETRQPAPPMEEWLTDKLTGEQRDAYAALKALFESYNLGTLAPKILEYVQQGFGADTISVLLQKTAEYETRFIANQDRKKAGLRVLTPSEYLAVEDAYRQIMRSSGLPKGFYDTNDDFRRFIAADVSPTELKSRVDVAVLATENADAATKEALKRMSVGGSDMVAYFLDPGRAIPIIQKQVATAQIGAAALRNKLEFDKSRAEGWYLQGVSADKAIEGFGAISGFLGDVQKLGQIYGEDYTQATAEAEVFGASGTAQAQRKRLASQERSQFAGSAGAARGGLSIKRT